MNETEQTRYSMRYSINQYGKWCSYVCHGMKMETITEEVEMKKHLQGWRLDSVSVDPNWKAVQEAASNYMQTFGTECE